MRVRFKEWRVVQVRRDPQINARKDFMAAESHGRHWHKNTRGVHEVKRIPGARKLPHLPGAGSAGSLSRSG